MPSDHCDLIVIGSGPGGASLAVRLWRCVSGAQARADGQAHPADRAGRLPAAVAGRLEQQGGVRGRDILGDGDLAR